MNGKENKQRFTPKSEAENLSGLTLLAVVRGTRRTTYEVIADGEVVGQVLTGRQAIIGRDEVEQRTVVIPYDSSFASVTENLPRLGIRDVTQLGGEIGKEVKITLRRAKPLKPQVRRRASR